MRKQEKSPRMKWVKLSNEKILKELKEQLAYSKLEKAPKKKPPERLNFAHSLYRKNGKYYFPYDTYVATTILEEASEYTNFFDLFLNNFFNNELNLYSTLTDFIEGTQIDDSDLLDEFFAESEAMFRANEIYNEAVEIQLLRNDENLYLEDFGILASDLFFLFLHKTCCKPLFEFEEEIKNRRI